MSHKQILAIDGSTTSTGIAIYDNTKLIYYTCITASGNTFSRIIKITDKIKEIYQKYNITNVIMEQVLPEEVRHNQATYKALMYLQASIVLMLHQKKQTVQFYTASHWRKICGIKTGRGIKRQELKKISTQLIKQKYGIDVNDDISDAICLGNAYAQQNGSAF